MWGRAGWHFRFFRLGDIPRQMRTTYNQEMRREESIPEEQIERLMESYRGRWVAVERCPHYWRKAGKEKLY